MTTGITWAIFLALPLWCFRYACRLILRARPARDLTAGVAQANGLRFPEVQRELLHAGGKQEGDRLVAMLQADYRLLAYLLRHGPAFQPGDNWIELRLQMLNFRVLGLYYSIIRRLSAPAGRRALEEMAQVVAYFANRMGERVAFATAAF